MLDKVRLFHAMKNKYFLYEVISKSPGVTLYDLAKKVNWTSGRVDYYIQKLLKDKVIGSSTTIENCQVKTQYFPVNYKNLINWDEMHLIQEI